MITCAVSIDESRWRPWLDAVGSMQVVRDVELPAGLVVDEPAALALADHCGLRVSLAHDLLPSDVTRYLGESPAAGRSDVIACLQDIIGRCRASGVRAVTLELGLDRIGDTTYEENFAERLRLLRGLMPVADRERIAVCVQVRYPRSYPSSKAWEYAGTLVHEVMHPSCRLAVDLVPGEFAPDAQPEDLVRLCYFRTELFRFHYDPALGEDLADGGQAEWAGALHRHGYKGAVVFCPRIDGEDGMEEACRNIDRWAQMYAAQR